MMLFNLAKFGIKQQNRMKFRTEYLQTILTERAVRVQLSKIVVIFPLDPWSLQSLIFDAEAAEIPGWLSLFRLELPDYKTICHG